MQRRGFLATAALTASGVAIGCGGVHARPELSEAETLELVGRLERGVRRLREQPLGSMARQMRGPRPDLTEQVLRITLESLVVLDVLRAMPEGAPVPAALGEALAPLLPRLDRCIHTHHALLSRMPVVQRRNFDRRVRERPAMVMDVAEWIDGHAAELGVPADNRVRLRHSAVTVGARLRRQSTDAVVADCAAKLDELFARQSTPLPPDLARATAGMVDAMWQQLDESASTGGALQSPVMRATPAAPPTASDPLIAPDRFGTEVEMGNPTEPVQWNDSWARPGDEEIRLGSIMLPLGLVTCGLLLIVGLIVVIAGQVQNDEWDGRSHADDATVQ